MISFINSLVIISPIFIIMCCGALIRTMGLIDALYITSSNKLLYYFFLPVFLFLNIYSSHLKHPLNIKLIIGYIIGTLATFILSYIFTCLRKYPPSIKGTFVQGSFRGNIGYIGLAIVFNTFGKIGLSTASILLGFLTPFINFLSILSFLIPEKKTKGLNNLFTLIKEVAVNPIIISSVLGILFNRAHIPVPDIIITTLSYISKVTLPLALFIIGASIHLPKFNKDIFIPIFVNIFKLIIMPMFIWIFLVFFHITGTDLYIGIIFAAAPTAVVTYVFASQFNGDMEIASLIVVISVILCFFTYPLIFQLMSI